MQHGRTTGAAAQWTAIFSAVGIAVLMVPGPAYADDGEELCDVGDERLEALHGLVATDDGFFAINDGTVTESQIDVIGMDESCQAAAIGVTGWIEPNDPKDLAVDDDGDFWVADIGNAAGERDSVALHNIPADGGEPVTYQFTYADGETPHAEALLLQPDGTPIFATWETETTELFAPVDDLDAENPVELESQGEFAIEATDTEGGPEDINGTPLEGEPSTFVTGGAVSPDGDRAVLRTYTDAYEWDVSDGDIAEVVTDEEPAVTPLANEPLGGAITYEAGGENFVTASAPEVDASGNTVEPAKMWTYEPAEAPESGGEDEGEEEDSGPGLASRLLGTLGVNGILGIIAGIGVTGLLMVIFGVTAIVKARKRRKAEAEQDHEFGQDSEYASERRPPEPPHQLRGEEDGLDGRSFEPAPRREAESTDRPYGRDEERGAGRVYGGRNPEGNSGSVYGGRGSTYGGTRESHDHDHGWDPDGRRGRYYGGGDDEGRSGSVYGGGR